MGCNCGGKAKAAREARKAAREAQVASAAPVKGPAVWNGAPEPEPAK